ncbi:S8 family serine peptidase [Natronobacterium texcoconense]|uniref:Serine protease n=1 Tax=Natronobacterium texcoconense TaxID=1095778 RepID=A0A1H1GCM2_NATTX|nr:S8 family serine peptidase [Natronobacterium texcoconense]SDR10566.1 serine protease [Natronobacterium texcoconense]
MSEGGSPQFDRRSVLKTAGALGAFLGFSGVTGATPGREPGPKKDELLVGFDDSVSNLQATAEPKIPSSAEIVHENETLGYVAVEFPSNAADRAKENFKKNVLGDRDIAYVEENATVEAFYTPDDPLYGNQYAPQQVNCEGAWETTLGDPGVTISIIDQGIQYDHENLAGNMDDSVSNYGYDFAGNSSDPYPATASEDHGTHVGGIAAGGTDNGTGHAGISDCSMLSARALDASGGGSLSDIADAIQWSADQGAEIINMSLGGGGYSSTMANACQYAYDQGSLLVAAAGNDYGGSVSYPAAYDTVMAVSSLDENENLSNFSNLGPEIELAAPGSNVLSAVNWGDYDSYSGTSMASPVAAGVAGLALSAHSGLSNEQLRSHLQNTAVDIGLSDDAQGYGRVDADGAVNTDPDDDDDDDDDDGGNGGSEESTITDSLSGSWDSDCWTYGWEFDDPGSVVIDLEGPSNATYDLYANERDTCPTTSDYDHISYTWGSDEEIVIENPDTSADLHVLVDAYSGSGEYTLTVTEYDS